MIFWHRKKIRIIVVIILMLLFQAVLSACLPEQSVPGGETTTNSETRPGEQTQVPDARPDFPSGVLRLWWPERSNLNPLADSSRDGQAVYDLIFQGLFRIEADQSITPVLADNIIFSPNYTQAEIRLKKNVFFHDGEPVRSEDVVACLDYLLTRQTGLGTVLDLQVISETEIVDEQTIRLLLTEPAPWLAYSLTFPVIPQSGLDATGHELIAGSGRFKMQSYSTQDGLWLELAEKSSDISALDTILVRSYPDRKRAMQAFEKDEIDLVRISADEYLLYSRRSDLRARTYAGNRLLLLALNSGGSRSLSRTENILMIKQIVDSQELRTDSWLKYGQPVNLPLPEDSSLLGGVSADLAALLSEPGEGFWQDENQAVDLVYPGDCELRSMLSVWLEEILSRAGIRVNRRSLAADQFSGTIESEDYDIALLETILPAAPDPLFILGSQQDLVPLVRQSITGYDEYQAWQELLAEIWNRPPGQMLPPADLSLALKHTTAQSPFIFLMIRSEAVLIGDRVRGQSRPDRYHPYEGIEELWVWSSQ